MIGRWFATLALASLLSAQKSPGVNTSSAVEAVHEAALRGDQATLAKWGRPPQDPWVIATALFWDRKVESAMHYARLVRGIEGTRLVAYLGGARASQREAHYKLDTALEIDDSQQALVRVREAMVGADDFGKARGCWTKAILHERLGQWQEAAAAWQQAADAAEAIGWLVGAMGALDGAAVVERNTPGGLEPAMALWQRRLRLAECREDRYEQAWTCLRVGNANGELGRYQRAITWLGKARSVLLEDAPSAFLFQTLMSEGLAHLRRGAPSEARVACERALEVARLSGDRRGANAAMLMLAEICGHLGETEHAVELATHVHTALAVDDLEALIADPQRRHDAVTLAEAAGTIGVSSQRLDKPAEALPFYQQALLVFRGIGNPRGSLVAEANSALSLMQLGRLDEADAVQQRVLAAAIALKDPFLVAEVRYHAGQILAKVGRAEEAARNDAELLRIGTELGSAQLLMRGHLNVARRTLAAGQAAEALSAARAAAAQVRRIVAGLAVGQDAAAREDRREVYEVGQHAAIAAGDDAALCWMVECGRAGALLESLGGANAIESAGAAPKVVADKAEAVEEQAVASHGVAAAVGDGEQEALAAALQRLREADRRVEAVAGMQGRDPTAVDDLVLQRIADAAAICATLAPGEALVLYLLLEPKALALVFTPTGFRRVDLEVTPDLGTRCGTTFSAVGSTRGRPVDEPRDADVTKQVEVLRRELWQPLQLDDSVHTVIVSPHGPLAQLPFCLLADKNIAYAASGSTLKLLRSRAGRGDEILAIGDALAPGQARLPGTAAEVRAVGNVVLAAADATKARLRQELAGQERWRAVHIACHGEVNLDDPLASALRLSASADDDGRFAVSDVLGMRFPADVVVLAACDTARGRLYRSEGVIGFTRAFLCAGASSVLVSLWPAHDDATKALMTSFHSAWQAGHSAAAALRMAQRAVAANKNWQAPGLWAGWQLWGVPNP